MSKLASPKHESSAITFPVDSVTPSQKLVWTEPLHDHLGKRFRRKVLLLPQPARPVTNCPYDSSLSYARERNRNAPAPDPNRFDDRSHPLVRAVCEAFAQHLPLTLSPDCIWLVIVQGFAHHITENAEVFRRRLVHHDGKRELNAVVNDLSLSSFESAISSFSSQIRDLSDPVLHETLVSNFSTTTPEIKTAFEVVLMDSYSSYFAYAMSFICGIPQITITGTIEDWQRIRARVEVLETFGLSWWVARIRPILDQFIRTVEGNPDPAFWQAICKPKHAYGPDSITGWIADLFPYLNDAPNRVRSHVFLHERCNWALPVEEGVKIPGGEPGAEKGISTKNFPSGLASVPVKISFPNNSHETVDLVAGFLSVEQDPQTLSLSPLIGWSVTEPPPAKPITVIR